MDIPKTHLRTLTGSLKAVSLLFENCLSHAPITGSSCASILSGFLPHETKVYENYPLPPVIDTIPKILQRHDYTTVAVVSNFFQQKIHGWSNGFTVFNDKMTEREQVRKLPEKIAKHTTNHALELLRQHYKSQLFMWVHYNDPHGPYTPPDRFSKMFYDPEQRPRILNLNSSPSGEGGIPSYQRLGKNRDYHHFVSQYDGDIRSLGCVQ